MRRLLPAIAAVCLCLAIAAPAFAGGRVPAGVKRITVTLTFPLHVGAAHRAVHRTLTQPVTVQKLVAAADLLRAPSSQGMCPMIMRLGPELTVVYRSTSGRVLAQTKVLVALGHRATSGSSYCFPITFTRGKTSQRLVGNSYVRLVGRIIGTPIS